MAKAASPIRLEKGLMQQAEITAKRFHRSTAEQVEYWADLGRSVASSLDPDILLSVASGIAKIKIEPVVFTPVEPNQVFDKLENDRRTGVLQNNISTKTVRYQASTIRPGYLEQIDEAGQITTGRFEKGQFIVVTDEQGEKR